MWLRISQSARIVDWPYQTFYAVLRSLMPRPTGRSDVQEARMLFENGLPRYAARHASAKQLHKLGNALSERLIEQRTTRIGIRGSFVRCFRPTSASSRQIPIAKSKRQTVQWTGTRPASPHAFANSCATAARSPSPKPIAAAMRSVCWTAPLMGIGV
jgi:hypothetical protein